MGVSVPDQRRVLVTGGAGFIGSNLVDALLEDGHEVIVIDDESSEAHDQFYWNPDAANHPEDVRNYGMTRMLYEGVECVFHLAAEARIQPAIINPMETVSINSVGTCTVLQCAREAGVGRVIYSSSSSVYGRHAAPQRETMPPDCLNPYSVSKLNGEQLCAVYTYLFDLPTVSLRYFNVYGPRQPLRGEYAPVVGLFLRQRAAGEALTIVGDGRQTRDFTHVADVVEANLLAMRPWRSTGEVYNVGSGVSYSINDVASMVSARVTHVPPRPGEAKATLADTRKIERALGWKPTMRLDDWINAQLEADHAAASA